jgi:cardiolipin synthase A/B
MNDWTLAAVVGGLLVLANIAVKVAALGIIPAGRKPSTGMAWLFLVLLNTVLGLVAFAFFGSARLDRRRQARQDQARERIRERTDEMPDVGLDPGLPAYVGTAVSLNRNLGSMPLVTGNTVELVPDYERCIEAMTADVETAEHHVYVEFYITAWDDVTDPFFRALTAAAERGVHVRMLFDHLGSRGIPGYKDMLEKLASTGIEWHRMLPIAPLKGGVRRPDLRNHRKLLVVDGKVAYTGSLNLTERGYNKPKNHVAGRQWVDLWARLQGPVVATVEAVFAQDWFTETGEVHPVEVLAAGDPAPGSSALRDVTCQLVPSGPGYVAENNLRLFTTLIYGATRRISLTSPYFVPDESLLYAVTTAAQRGVDVELFVSEVSDQFMVGHAQASYYRALLEAGVRIHGEG